MHFIIAEISSCCVETPNTRVKDENVLKSEEIRQSVLEKCVIVTMQMQSQNAYCFYSNRDF